MGFSVEVFFEQLIAMLADSAKHEAGDAASDLRRIQSFVEGEYRYAKECGNVRWRVTWS